jgi:curli biogenesis system outer membrane secretion channel CsgG
MSTFSKFTRTIPRSVLRGSSSRIIASPFESGGDRIRCTGLRGALLFLAAVLLVAGCASAPETPSEPVSVAVWDLENLSYEPGAYPDMGQVLAGRIIETIRQKGEYQVVERQRIMAILQELNLGSSALADENTRLRIGRLSGARRMIFGGYQTAGDAMRIDLRLVEVETGKIIKTSEKTAAAGDLAGWLDSASLAAAELF